MLYPFDFIDHWRDCKRKQNERASKIASLPKPYLYPLSPSERSILDRPIADLVKDVQDNAVQPVDILRTYGKVAIKAHESTNCLTEIMFPDAEEWVKGGDINLKGPLAGIPVSLKDSIAVGGFDVSVGFSRNTGKPYAHDGSHVRLLKEAGAVPFVKTNLPVTLLSFESTNDVWGRCTNPHNKAYSPGGSTGGESALLAFGGSRIGVGSDVAGSVRAPAHFAGCYSLRCSTGRWPKMGMNTSMPGQEGVPSVFSPLGRTLDDLHYFTRAFIQCGPWRYDHSVHPLEWREKVEEEYRDKKVLRVGVMRTDRVIDPSPACARALDLVAKALKEQGHDVFDVEPPDPYEGLLLASQLLNADGCAMFRSFLRTGEHTDPGAGQMSFYMDLPRPIKYLYYLWVKYVRRDPLWAGLLRDWRPKTAFENWKLVSKRETYKAEWHDWWRELDGGKGMDFMITPPNATPAVPHGAMKNAVSSCGYTFLFNMIDYTTGIIPVTKVNRVLDQLPADFNIKELNGVARGAYMYYDAIKMEGLPVGVQVVGRRLEEEKVLVCMGRCEDALEKSGVKYEMLEVE